MKLILTFLICTVCLFGIAQDPIINIVSNDCESKVVVTLDDSGIYEDELPFEIEIYNPENGSIYYGGLDIDGYASETIPEGEYEVKVEYGGECFRYEEVTVTRYEDMNQIVVDSEDCNDGNFDITVIGGIAPYTIFWTGEDGFEKEVVITEFSLGGTEDVYDLSRGKYVVRVADDCNNVVSKEMVSTKMELGFNLVEHICGDSRARLYLDMTEYNESDFTFKWFKNGILQEGFHHASIVAASSGNYCVNVIDEFGCITELCQEIYDFSEMISFNITPDCSDDGEDTGSIALDYDLPEEVSILEDLWILPSGEEVQDLPNPIPTGEYILRTTFETSEGFSCTVDKKAVVNNVDARVLITQNGNICSLEGLNLSIYENSDWTSYFPIFWYKDGILQSEFSNMASIDIHQGGSYLFLGKHPDGCYGIGSIDVGESEYDDLLSLESFKYDNCDGGDNEGSIKLKVDSREGYSIAGIDWKRKGNNSVIGTGLEIDHLSKGKYSYFAQVMDPYGAIVCVLSDDIYIGCCDEDDGIQVLLDDIEVDKRCDGVISIDIVSQSNPNYILPQDDYILKWTGPNNFTSSDETILGLCSGQYCAHIKSGCQDFIECFYLPTCESIRMNIETKNSCMNFNNGEVHISSADFEIDKIVWSDGYEGLERTNLSAGNHGITAYFKNGCVRNTAIKILSLSPEKCEETCEGSGPAKLYRKGDPGCVDWCGDNIVELGCDKLKLKVYDEDVDFSIHINHDNTMLNYVDGQLDDANYLNYFFSSTGQMDLYGYPYGPLKYTVVDKTRQCVYHKVLHIPKRCFNVFTWIKNNFSGGFDNGGSDDDDDGECTDTDFELLEFDYNNCEEVYICDEGEDEELLYVSKLSECKYKDHKTDEWAEVLYCELDCIEWGVPNSVDISNLPDCPSCLSVTSAKCSQPKEVVVNDIDSCFVFISENEKSIDLALQRYNEFYNPIDRIGLEIGDNIELLRVINNNNLIYLTIDSLGKSFINSFDFISKKKRSVYVGAGVRDIYYVNGKFILKKVGKSTTCETYDSNFNLLQTEIIANSNDFEYVYDTRVDIKRNLANTELTFSKEIRSFSIVNWKRIAVGNEFVIFMDGISENNSILHVYDRSGKYRGDISVKDVAIRDFKVRGNFLAYMGYSVDENGKRCARSYVVDITAKMESDFKLRESFKNSLVDVFPIPYKDLFELSFYLQKTEKLTLNIYDITGRIEKSMLVQGRKGLNRINVTDEGVSGTKLLVIKKGSEVFHKCIIKI